MLGPWVCTAVLCPLLLSSVPHAKSHGAQGLKMEEEQATGL